MNGLIFLAAQFLGPLFIVIMVPVILYWIFSGGKNTQGETSTGLSKGSSEIAEGCGAGCLLGLAVIGFMGFVIYRIFVAIPSY